MPNVINWLSRQTLSTRAWVGAGVSALAGILTPVTPAIIAKIKDVDFPLRNYMIMNGLGNVPVGIALAALESTPLSTTTILKTLANDERCICLSGPALNIATGTIGMGSSLLGALIGYELLEFLQSNLIADISLENVIYITSFGSPFSLCLLASAGLLAFYWEYIAEQIGYANGEANREENINANMDANRDANLEANNSNDNDDNQNNSYRPAAP